MERFGRIRRSVIPVALNARSCLFDDLEFLRLVNPATSLDLQPDLGIIPGDHLARRIRPNHNALSAVMLPGRARASRLIRTAFFDAANVRM